MPWFVGCGSIVRESDLVGEVTQCFCGFDLVSLVGFMGLIWWVLVVSGFWLFCLDGSWFFFLGGVSQRRWAAGLLDRSWWCRDWLCCGLCCGLRPMVGCVVG